MYKVVEFSEDAGGGVSVIRREWLTPRKQRCMWPPQKLMTKFNKCIDGSIHADDNTWDIYNIKRVFYETDSLAKARAKAKEAEVESEINSDNNFKLSKRKRKKNKKIYDSEIDTDSGDSIDTTHRIIYPKQPTTTLTSGNQAAINKKQSTQGSSTGEGSISEIDQNKAVTDKVRSRPGTSTEEEWASDNRQHPASANKVSSRQGTSDEEEWTSDNHQNPAPAYKVRSRPGTSDEGCAFDNHRYQVAANKVRCRPNTFMDETFTDKDLDQPTTTPQNNSVIDPSSVGLSSLDLTITPFFKESTNSEALEVIARHLARIETDLKELQISQNELLQRLRSSTTTSLDHALPDGISLPCDDYEGMIKIETWINAAEENKKKLVSYLSLVGGTKKPIIIRRILEKVFTNKLAVGCNWTGKNKKIPLKDLELIKVIRYAVRQNYIAEKATDAEIHEVISNWFRFTKDRDGGREARRVKQ